MAIHEYNNQTISDTRQLRAELQSAGEGVAIYTVIGGYVKVEACDAAVAAAND